MKNNDLLKEEIRWKIPAERCCLLAALKVAFRFYGTFRISSTGPALEFKKEDRALLRRTLALFKRAFPGDYDFEIMYDEKKYWVNIHVSREILNELDLLSENAEFLPDTGGSGPCCRDRYLMEVILYKGYLFSFEDSYQLEIRNPAPFGALITVILDEKAVKFYEYEDRILIRGISNLSGLFESAGLTQTAAVLRDFGSYRADKNKTVRLVNYSMANLNRQVNGYERDREMLEDFLITFGFDILPDYLRELAMLRIGSPGLTLTELGALLEPPLTKGGVSSRMKKIYRLYAGLKGRS